MHYIRIIQLGILLNFAVFSGGCFPFVMKPVRTQLNIQNVTTDTIVLISLPFKHSGKDESVISFANMKCIINVTPNNILLVLLQNDEKIKILCFGLDFLENIIPESDDFSFKYSFWIYNLQFKDNNLIYLDKNNELIKEKPYKIYELLLSEKDNIKEKTIDDMTEIINDK